MSGWLIAGGEVTGGAGLIGWAVWQAARFPSWRPGAVLPAERPMLERVPVVVVPGVVVARRDEKVR